MQRRKSGLATPRGFLIGPVCDRKGTSRITGSSRPIVHIDGAVWYIAVGSSYPGCASATKGVGVHALKGIVSWVKNVNNKLTNPVSKLQLVKVGVPAEFHSARIATIKKSGVASW